MPLINRIGGAAALLQEKTVTETIYNDIVVTPDADIDGMSKVTIAAQPVYDIKTGVLGSSVSELVISGLKREPIRVMGTLFDNISYSAEGVYEFGANKEAGAWSGTAFGINSGNQYNTVNVGLTVVYSESNKTLTLTRKTSATGWKTTGDGYTVSVFY